MTTVYHTDYNKSTTDLKFFTQQKNGTSIFSRHRFITQIFYIIIAYHAGTTPYSETVVKEISPVVLIHILAFVSVDSACVKLFEAVVIAVEQINIYRKAVVAFIYDLFSSRFL